MLKSSQTPDLTPWDRYTELQPVGMGAFGLVWYIDPLRAHIQTLTVLSSAKDQITGQPVAVKKIMKPFSTPVLAKRTFRELKLLKHLRHENVSPMRPDQHALIDCRS
jgi:p38 MAP kinase